MKIWDPRPRQPLAFLAVWAVLGIFAADRWSAGPWVSLTVFLAAAIALLWRPSTPGCWLVCGAAFFALHTLLYHGAEGQMLARGFASGPRVLHATGVVWDEPKKPAVWSRNVTARFRLRLESVELAGETRPADVLMNVSWAGAMPAYGDRVSLIGSVKLLESPRNPGQFDYAGYARRQGVFSEIHARFPLDCQIEGHGHGTATQAFAFQATHWIQNWLTLDLEDSPEMVDLIASMILGMQGDTPEDMKALFQRTGTMHLFAVSGLNVAMLAAIALFLLRPLRVGRVASALLIIPILILYALVTGLSASCVRATVMGSLILLGHVCDRPTLAYNSLGASALVILAWDTNQLFSAGFQFSFVLVIALVAFATRIQHVFEPIAAPDAFLPRELWTWRQKTGASVWKYCAASLGVTISAWFGSLLFTAGYFHLFSPAAVVANLIAVPLSFVVLILGVASLLAAPFWKAGVVLCNNANWGFAKLLLAVLKLFALVPGGYIYVETPRFKRPPAADITVLDLGGGGAVHLRTQGRDWLLDCGSGFGYDRIVLPYLRTRGVNQLDGLLLTHGDTKCIGSAITVLNDFAPGSIAESVMRDRSAARKRFHVELAGRNIGKALYERGDHVRINKTIDMQVLYPEAGLKRSAADDKALVLRFDCEGTRVLFMSDSGLSTEQWLTENEPDLRADLIVKGQHAKDLSGTLDFLAHVQPRAIICKPAAYGEPPEVLDAWEREVVLRGITVFRQDRSGAVHVEIREGGFEARAFLNGQTFFNRAR